MKQSKTFLSLLIIGSALWGLRFADTTVPSATTGAGQETPVVFQEVSNNDSFLEHNYSSPCDACLSMLKIADQKVEGFPLESKEHCTAIKPAYRCALASQCYPIDARQQLMFQKCDFKLTQSSPCDECHQLRREGLLRAEGFGASEGSNMYCRAVFYSLACYRVKHCPDNGTLHLCSGQLMQCDGCAVFADALIDISYDHDFEQSSLFCKAIAQLDRCTLTYDCGRLPKKLTRLEKGACPAVLPSPSMYDGSPRVTPSGSVTLIFLLLVAGLLAGPVI